MADDSRMDGDAEFMSTDPIRGICQDMCPANEREVRERTGALDPFERVDGDRNQTSVNLALKKYTRTPERSPEAIRPLPVLQQSMSYMLSLLDRPYNEGDLLGHHSFLWDRMRAVRMDLRMQHLFGAEAIQMHEQMIRFHIVAMHELCEHPKPEGLTEGFDAHLNIEQMNKACVDLFEMYNDHRSRGEPVASEAEFRGYYALLKIDQHPGFNVQPGELAKDLSHMPPELRRSPEVLFAREVARATRTGNFVAFFRLARKATYLQACLMHAHFSKVRAEALAALNTGLGPKQVMSLDDISTMLGMEGENIEEFISQQGLMVNFSSENGSHIVKERGISGLIQASMTCRSPLVQSKRSQSVVADVITKGKTSFSSSPPINSRPVSPFRQSNNSFLPPNPSRRDIGSAATPIVFRTGGQTVISGGTAGGRTADGPEAKKEKARKDLQEAKEREAQMEKTRQELKRVEQQKILEKDRENQRQQEAKRQRERKEKEEALKKRQAAAAEAAALAEHEARRKRMEKEKERMENEKVRLDKEKEIMKRKIFEAEKKALEAAAARHKEEAETGRLRTLIRRWRRRVMGRPPSLTARQLDEQAKHLRTQFAQKTKDMWASLDVPSLIGSTLQARNSDTECLCFKLLVCSRILDKPLSPHKKVPDYNTTRLIKWLRSKLIPTGTRPGWVEGSPGESPSEANLANIIVNINGFERRVGLKSKAESSQLCYIAKEVGFHDTSLPAVDAGHGTSAVIFVVDASQPLVAERERLNSVVNCLSPGAKTALLILAPRTLKEDKRKGGVSEVGEIQKAFSPFHKHGNIWDIGVELESLRKRRKGAPEVGTLRGKGVSLNNQTLSQLLAQDLELGGLDKGRVVAWKVVPIAVTLEEASFGRKLAPTIVSNYIEDTPIIEGLRWLAEKSPSQPSLRGIEARKLAMEYIDSAVQRLVRIDPKNVLPEDVIDGINTALGHLQKDVKLAYDQCPPIWPPPELPQNKIAPELLPRSDSLSADGVAKALQFLDRCFLPKFDNALLSVPGENSLPRSLQQQSAVLREALGGYLSSLAPPAPSWVIKHEVDTLLEQSCSVIRNGNKQILVPMWVHVFKGLISMRLAHTLASEPHMHLYVLSRTKKLREAVPEVGSKSLFVPIPLSELLASEKEQELKQSELQIPVTSLEERNVNLATKKSPEQLLKSGKPQPVSGTVPKQRLCFQRTKASSDIAQMLERVKSAVWGSQLELETDPDVYAHMNVKKRRTAHEILESARKKKFVSTKNENGQQEVESNPGTEWQKCVFEKGTTVPESGGTQSTFAKPLQENVTRDGNLRSMGPREEAFRQQKMTGAKTGLRRVSEMMSNQKEGDYDFVLLQREASIAQEAEQIRSKRRTGNNVLEAVQASRKKLKAMTEAVLSSARNKRELMMSADPSLVKKLEARLKLAG